MDEDISVGRDTPLLDRIAYTLHGDYDAHITEIEVDQWAGVGAATRNVEYEETERPKLKVWVECDLLEDGLMRAWKYFADNDRDHQQVRRRVRVQRRGPQARRWGSQHRRVIWGAVMTCF